MKLLNRIFFVVRFGCFLFFLYFVKEVGFWKILYFFYFVEGRFGFFFRGV